MRAFIFSGRVLLAVASLALGGAVYYLVPAARLAPVGYWTAVGVYVIAAELAWYLTERQTLRRPRLLESAGQAPVTTGSYRDAPGYEHHPGMLPDPFLIVGSDGDIERDIQASLLNELTEAGKDNRYELIVGPPGIGKSVLLHRIGLELLDRGCTVSTLNTEKLTRPIDENALKTLGRETARLFVLADDSHLRPGLGKLLELLIGAEYGITVLGTTTQAAYEVMVRGTAGGTVSPRDLHSLADVHSLRMTPREAQKMAGKLKEKYSHTAEILPVDRVRAAGSASDMLSLSIGLVYGEEQGVYTVSVAEDLPRDTKRVLVGLCMLSLAHAPVETRLLEDLLGPEVQDHLQIIADRNVATEYNGNVYGPHPLLASGLLKSPTLTDFSTLLEMAEEIITELVEDDHARAASIMRALAHRHGTDMTTQLWTQTRNMWIERATRLSPMEVVECFVPMLHTLERHSLIADLCESYLDEQGMKLRAAFQRGIALYNLESFTAARATFTEFIDQEPYADLARLNTALCDLSQGHYRPAERYLNSLSEDEQDMPGLHYLLGYLSELQGDVERAMDLYKHARAVYSRDHAALVRRAALKIRTGSPGEAIKLYEAGIQHTPEKMEFYGGLAVAHEVAGNTQRSIVQSARAIQAGVEPAAARKAVAEAYMDYGMYDLAVSELENCLAYSPGEAEAKLMLGQCRINQNDLEAAEMILQEAVAEHPEFVDAGLEYAACLRDLNKAQEADEALKQIPASRPGRPELHLLQASIAANLGDTIRQREAAERAEVLGDETGWGSFMAARAIGEPSAHWREAIQLFNAARVTAPSARDAAAMLHATAVCYDSIDEHPEAIAAGRNARKLILGQRHHGEPVFSAVDLRRIPTRDFLSQLRSIIEKLESPGE